MKDYVIIGSCAMKYHYPDFPRIPMDRDIIITQDLYFETVVENSDIETIQENLNGLSSVVKFKSIPIPVEYFFAEKQDSLDRILRRYDRDKNNTDYICPEVLYSLKKSHIHYPIKFHKHIKDYMFLRDKLRQKKEISLTDDLLSTEDLLDGNGGLGDRLSHDIEERLGKLKTPKMDQTTEEFFGKSKNHVKSYFIHDDMHIAIADNLHRGNPIYEKILKDGSQVETDVSKWLKLSLNERLWCVLEEVYVIALERKILPHLFDNEEEWTPKKAFDWALYRVCTTLCDGFFREFATKAYDTLQSMYNPYYVEHFFKSIKKYDRKSEKSKF